MNPIEEEGGKYTMEVQWFEYEYSGLKHLFPLKHNLLFTLVEGEWKVEDTPPVTLGVSQLSLQRLAGLRQDHLCQ